MHGRFSKIVFLLAIKDLSSCLGLQKEGFHEKFLQ